MGYNLLPPPLPFQKLLEIPRKQSSLNRRIKIIFTAQVLKYQKVYSSPILIFYLRYFVNSIARGDSPLPLSSQKLLEIPRHTKEQSCFELKIRKILIIIIYIAEVLVFTI